MRRILIATPIRQGVSSGYLQWLLPVMSNPQLLPGREFGFSILDGPSVNFARNELAQYALDEKFEEIVFVDDDMGGTLGHLDRITSHADRNIVGGIYCKRHPGKPHWLVRTTPGAVKDDRGLIQCDYIATGWLWIRCQVFDTIREAQPWRDFAVPATDEKPERVLHEYFPMGVVGPRTAEERLAKIRAVLKGCPEAKQIASPLATTCDMLNAIVDAVSDHHPPGNLLGEDYYFCHVARQCGYKIYADLECVVSHVGRAPYPITQKQVMA
ncbi:MAG TPA: hypothetical protein VEC57_00130 [Candidatus Limnocylindrales bacterium]|nr:hypothetical protein [Candidatus Limnocylindrales bacterium]